MPRLALLIAALASGQASIPAQCLQKANLNANKIVGGDDANPQEFPSIASLHDRHPDQSSGSFCGGTLVGDRWVMTAAHCAIGGDTQYVVLGGHDQDNPDECREVIKVKDYILHESYDDWTTQNDIALLELETPSAYAPVRANLQEAELFEGTMVTVAGWGATQEGGSVSSVLQKVDVPVSNQADCHNVYDITGAMRNQVICSGLPQGGKDSCQGDSGGPLFVGGAVAGVVSFGIGCAREGFPGVYTKVSYYQDWVCGKIDGCTPLAPTNPPAPTLAPAPTSPPTFAPPGTVPGYCLGQTSNFSAGRRPAIPGTRRGNGRRGNGRGLATRARSRTAPEADTRSASRIVGGVAASSYEFPFIVSMHTAHPDQVYQSCGGSLIGDRWVLTAAHCTQGGDMEYVVLGGHDQNNEEDPCREVIKVKRHIEHPGYDDWTTQNDIALLELERPSAYASAKVAMLKSVSGGLPSSEQEGTVLTVAGWGTLMEGGDISSVLQKVDVPVTTQADCHDVYDIPNDMKDQVICAGEVEKDSCQGDSGGPLFSGSSGDFQLVGIVSFGEGCAREERPGVYTRVSHYNDWVCSEMGGCDDSAPTPTRPTPEPTASPTKKPTKSPTANPTAAPTKNPTASPTKQPTASPTKQPTASPTTNPTSFPTASPTASSFTCPVSDDDGEESGGFDWGSGCVAGSGCFTLDLPQAGLTENVGKIPAGKFDVFVRLQATGDIDIRLYDMTYRGEDNQWPEATGQAIVAWCGSNNCNGWDTIGMFPVFGEATYERSGIAPMTIEYSGYNGQNGNLGDEYIRITGETSAPLMMQAYAYAAGTAKVTYSWAESRSACCTGNGPCGGSFTQPVAQNGILDIGEIPTGKLDVSINLVTPDKSDVDVQLYDLTDTDPFAEGQAIVAWCEDPSSCNIGAMSEASADTIFYPAGQSAVSYYWTGYNGQNGNLGDETISIIGTTDRPLMMKVFGYSAGTAEVSYTYWNPKADIETTDSRSAGRARQRGLRSRLRL